MNTLCLIGASMLMGVIVVDLKFDMLENKEYTKSYYLGHESASSPG
jgi:hypothetical protein